jgi:ParB family transcriptional regulator, chromosome partitioning protein
MNSPPAVRYIPLDKLVPSPTNVRKTPPSAAEDAELKASIRARGLKQNLVVHPAAGENGVHAVTAGGRRLKALQELAAEGVIPADFKVPCLIEEPEVAIETSLMENRIRAALSPADEFVAMATLIDRGETVEAVATRFGVSERHVRQRLRLGKLAPELLDAYRNGDISLDVVTAFTLGADHQAQLAVWHQLKDQSYIPPYTVRRLLTQTAIPVDSDLGLFVGSAAYEAAGGTVTRDLFSGDDEGFMDDAALVRRLAMEKLEQKAAELHSSWAWTKAMLDSAYDFTAQYRRIRPQPAALPPEIVGEIERIEERLAELEEISEDEWTAELITEAARLDERRDELAESVENLAVYSEKDRATAGVIVTIGDDGEFRLHEGLVERSAIDAEHSGDDETVGFKARPDDEISRYSPNAEQALRKECGFSQVLVDDLKAYRLQITRAHLATDFDVAFDLALYALCVDLFERFGYRSHPLDLRGDRDPIAQFFERSRRHRGRSPARGPGQHARSRLAQTTAGRKLRGAHSIAVRAQTAALRAMHRPLPQAAAVGRGRGRSGHRSRRPPPFHPVCRLLAADRRQLLGPGQEGARPRDRQGYPRRPLGKRPRR